MLGPHSCKATMCSEVADGGKFSCCILVVETFGVPTISINPGSNLGQNLHHYCYVAGSYKTNGLGLPGIHSLYLDEHICHLNK